MSLLCGSRPCHAFVHIISCSNAMQCRSKWSLNDRRKLKVCLLHFEHDWPTTPVAFLTWQCFLGSPSIGRWFQISIHHSKGGNVVVIVVDKVFFCGVFAALRRRVWKPAPSNWFQRTLSGPLCIANAHRFQSGWSKIDQHTLTFSFLYFWLNSPTTSKATATEVWNNYAQNFSWFL